MKKLISFNKLAFLILGGSLLLSFSAQGFSFRAGRGILWTWMGGSQGEVSSVGTYGTKGTPSTSNIPAARLNGCGATAPDGTLWLFGGDRYVNKFNYYNDLWRYNPTTEQWTWLAGGNTGTTGGGQNGVWGTKGTADPSNTPSTRKDLACWVDSTGKFWLFGGLATTTTNYNDLWRFDPATSQWTWISGSNTTNPAAVYGTKGVESATNVPSGRERMTYWIDSSDNLWIFGGWDDNQNGRKNDLWRYRISTGHWTWMSGPSAVNQAGVYGTKGTPSTANYPGARRPNHNTFGVDSAGNLWLFGGDDTANGKMNDLWKYNPSTNEWTWVAGANTAGPTPSFGTKLVPNATNTPYGRSSGHLLVGKDDSINVFMGWSGLGDISDFMSFSPSSGMWTWLGGVTSLNAAPVYGTLSTPSWLNTPGGRDGAIAWVDKNGAFWIFGGTVADTYNDLWKGVKY